MRVRLRFVLSITLVVCTILLASFFIVYTLTAHNIKEEFDNRLWAHAYNEYATYYHIKDSDKIITDKLYYYLPGEPSAFRSVLLDNSYKIIKASPADFSYKPSIQFLQKLKDLKEVHVYRDSTQAIGLYLNTHGKEAYVITSGLDRYAVARLNALKRLMVYVGIIGTLITAIFSFVYVMIVTRPLVNLSIQMRNVTEGNLRQRFNVIKGNEKNNELVQIANNFNNMLDRLEKAFQFQKNFVHHASHELRTPLATMLAQTESALRKDLKPEEVNEVLESLKEDQQEMIDLTNSLLLLSQYENLQYSSNWPKVRIEELIYETMENARRLFPGIGISFDFVHVPEKESYLYINGNETLLRSAFRNLIKNAYVYSDDKCVAITMEAGANAIYIHFKNNGLILNTQDRERMYLPFFRGENAKHKKGFGLGLSIIKRIVELHKGQICYKALGEDLNQFTVELTR